MESNQTAIAQNVKCLPQFQIPKTALMATKFRIKKYGDVKHRKCSPVSALFTVIFRTVNLYPKIRTKKIQTYSLPTVDFRPTYRIYLRVYLAIKTNRTDSGPTSVENKITHVPPAESYHQQRPQDLKRKNCSNLPFSIQIPGSEMSKTSADLIQ
jgi:hypothetical protein